MMGARPSTSSTAAMINATLYYNDACSKCRGTLALLESRGIQPTLVEYLVQPPSRETLADLLRKLGLPARAILRVNDDESAALGLDALDETGLIDALAANPTLIQRPILVVEERAVICRPPERALELLDGPTHDT